MKLSSSIKIIFTLVILILGGIGFWLYNAMHTPVNHGNAKRYIVILRIHCYAKKYTPMLKNTVLP